MTGHFRSLKFSKNEVIIFIGALFVTISAKGIALFTLTYSIDDYFNILSPSIHSNNVMAYVSQGRFGQALLSKLVFFLGSSAPLTNTFYVFLFMISLIWVGLIVCRIWKLSDDLIAAYLVVLFVVIHPYQAELFTFKCVPIYGAIAFFLAYIGFYFTELKLKHFLWTNCCIIFALSIYQVVLNYIFITLCLAIVFEMSRQYNSNKSIKWQQVREATTLWPRLITICFSVIFYLIINKIIQNVLHIAPEIRSQLINFNDLSHRVREIGGVLIRIFIMTEHIFPFSLKIMLIVIGFLAILFSGERILIQGSDKSKIRNYLLILTLLLLSVVGIIGVILPSKGWWPVSRVLSAVSLFWAGIVALAYLNSDRKFKPIIFTISAVVLFGFIGINNHIFTGQLRLNIRDINKANRIINRLESHPDFSKVRRVTVSAGTWGYPLPISTLQGDMNMSAFYPSWSKVNILKEVSGYDFIDATPSDNEKAEQYCKEAPKWPHPDSVIIDNDLGIVCF